MDVFAKLLGDRNQTLLFSRLLKSHARPLPFWKNPVLACTLMGGQTRRATFTT
jgi:hypothetical protein